MNARRPGGPALMDRCPDVPEMAAAWRAGRVERITTPDGVSLAVRIFNADANRPPVVLLHGLQSHSGWFVQSCRHLALLGHPVHAFDRRGSGLSGARRGDIPAHGQMVDDLDLIVEHARHLHAAPSVIVVGHCLGAVPAILFATRNPHRVRSLVLATPALHVRPTLPPMDMLRTAWAQITASECQVPIPYPAEMLADAQEYLSFIQNDDLSLASLTSRSYIEILRARRTALGRPRCLDMPVFAALAGRDAILDNPASEAFLRTISPSGSRLVTYASARHILEFSHERDAFFRDLGEWLGEDRDG